MRQLLFSVTPKDCERQTFRSGGPGGQNQNKRDTGVRFIHRDSGARGESREFRTQGENAKAAWKKMTQDIKFKLWLNRRLMQGPTPEELVAQDMDPKNLKVERLTEGGQWVTI